MPTIALSINIKSKSVRAISTIKSRGRAVAPKGSIFLYDTATERTPRELQKLINTARSFQKQFAKVGVTLDVDNCHRAHLNEKGINRDAARALAKYLYEENTRALLASAKVYAKYGF